MPYVLSFMVKVPFAFNPQSHSWQEWLNKTEYKFEDEHLQRNAARKAAEQGKKTRRIKDE